MTSSIKSQTRQRSTDLPRSRRYTQRFLTGLLLGMILAATIGAFTPLLAQSPTNRELSHNPTAPLLSGEPSSPQGLKAIDANGVSLAILPSDIAGHWAANCINALAQRQAIPFNESALNSGDEGVAQFYPEAPATWSAVVAMLNQSFPTAEAYGGAAPLEAALQLPSPINVLYTYPQEYYRPDCAITRAEAITAVAAKAQLPYVARANEALAASLEDGDRVPAYAREGVAAALSAGVLVNPRNAQRVESFTPITRGEVAALICQASPDVALRTTIAPEWIARSIALLPQNQTNPEVRGVWLTNIDSEVLFSQDNLAEGIQRLKALNINTLYPVVWNMGYTQYPSQVAERLLGQKRRLWPGDNPQFEQAQGDRDMLQELIELAHAEGMAVIPWFEFGFMAPGEYRIRNEHPDWFTQRQDGTQDIVMGAEVFTWMNPFHPQTRRLLLALIAEVLENYDVEGIQVDDHLGLPVDMGYDPYTLSLYQQEHGGDLPPDDHTDADWMRWRANKITEFMGDVRALINQRRPEALLSVSPNPYPFSYAQYLQDWPAWEAADLLDEVIVQIYRDDLDRFVWELNKPATRAASQRTPTSIGLLSGLRGRPTDVELLTAQLEAVRDCGYAGVSYFFYQSLWAPGRETAEERNRQFQTSFSQTVVRP